ncbi:MAG: type II toxin-antitoxin system VapC family toxin [Armatimonadetes bacterium]|nr:type II toxin-antitoxin system VapC family toxin [Armatimonadota bacterium]
MIFVDTNVLMYAVGRPHPLRGDARAFFEDCRRTQVRLSTSAEVLQELMHAYLPVQRLATLDAALMLVEGSIHTVWPLEAEDVELARLLVDSHPELGARDLLHLACCRRRGVVELKTFGRALDAVARKVL